MTLEEALAKIKELDLEIKALGTANLTDTERSKRLMVLNTRLAETIETMKAAKETTENSGMTKAELMEKIKNETATNEEIIRFGIENAEELGIDADVLKGDTTDDKFNNLKETINSEFRKGGI